MNSVLQHRCSSPLVSVIMPVLNAEATVAEALGSILSQDYEYLEVIVVDDGSTDGTVSQVASLEDSRVSILQSGGRGVSHARNVGMGAATGESIMFVDSDDEIAPNSIANAVALIESFHADMVIGGLSKVWSNGRAIDFAINSDVPVEFSGQGISALVEATVGYSSIADPRLNSCHLTGSCCRLIRRQQLEGLRFKETLPIGEDTVFNVGLLKRCGRVIVTPEIWYRYRQSSGSAVYRYRENAFQEGADMLLALREKLVRSHSDALRRRALYQLEGAVRQRVAPGCREASLFQKARAIQEGLQGDFWSGFLSDPSTIPGLTIKHRGFLFFARHRMATALCIAVQLAR